MRHTQPKYSINQLVPVELVGTGIIKGMQLKPSLDNSGKFTTDGWEYSVWRQVEGYPGGFQDCGWVMLQTSTNFYLPTWFTKPIMPQAYWGIPSLPTQLYRFLNR